jgi:hypothetical protein
VNPPPIGTPEEALAAAPPGLHDALAYPYFQSVFDRKSRRMALGMDLQAEYFQYTSPYEPIPLTELEEALLLVAATGLNGINLADIDPSHGAEALCQWTARTWPSSCSNHGTELFFTNDDGLYFLDMWGLMPEPGELNTLSGKPIEAQVDFIIEMARRAKVQLSPGRAQLPTSLPGLFVFNHWNANKQGTHLFVPVANMTLEYINLLFIYLTDEYRFSIVDEQNGWASAGLQKWIDKGRIDPNRRMGMIDLEQRVLSMQVVESAFICHNLNLAMQAMGLGGWTFTGFISRFILGGEDVPGLGFRFVQPKEGPGMPVGVDGHYEAFTPPYYADMHEAVDAFLETKWSQYESKVPKPYLEPDKALQNIPRPDDETIAIVKDYCQYVYETYGRFPANLDAMYQRLVCQVQHVDTDFYEQYYPPGAVTDQHHRHFAEWHPELADQDGKPPRADG